MGYCKKSGAALLASSAFALGMIISAPAQAALIDGGTTWEDLSVESQNVDLNSNSVLDVGDTLRGIVDITRIINAGGLRFPGINELTLSAVFEAEVLTKVPSVTGPAGTFDFTFGPYAGFATDLGLDAGAMAAFYTDATVNFAIGPPGCTTIGDGGDCEANVIDGDLYLVLGMLGIDPDEAWLAIGAPEDPTDATFGTSTDPLGDFDANLTIITNLTGFSFGQVLANIALQDGISDDMIDVALGGHVLGTSDLDTPYDVFDDSKFRMLQVERVPEPMTLALFGAGLLGLAWARRRRARA